MIYPANGGAAAQARETDGLVSFQLAGQWLGIPVTRIQEVLVRQRISPVPLAPPEVEGFLNLRGQIVTAIDLRTRLGLSRRAHDEPSMSLVIRDGDELFSLIVDSVSDVVATTEGSLEPPPASLDAQWRLACDGVVRLPMGLLVVVNVDELLRITDSR